MKEKIFVDTRTQLGILKSRGLIINNKKFAKRIIREVGYYNLINGYKDLFLVENTKFEKYISGTKFEEIYAIYQFDRALRILTLEYTLEIENKVKTLVSYCFSKIHGHKNYLRLENFDTVGTGKYEQVCKLLTSLYNKIILNINKDLSISHYVTGKNYIPLWVLTKSISMSDISKFYVNMIQSEREEVAKRMKWGIRENQLGSCLHFLSTIRNVCAHDGRLYSYLSHVNLKNNIYFRYFNITQNTNNYFAVMIAFKLLLSRNEYEVYQNKFERLFTDLVSSISTIPVHSIRNKMGLPNNWRRLKSL